MRGEGGGCATSCTPVLTQRNSSKKVRALGIGVTVTNWNCEEMVAKTQLPPKTAVFRRIIFNLYYPNND